MMGVGFWLNPRNGKSSSAIKHDDWLRVPSYAVELGLDRETAERISKIKDNDEIRLAGIEAGLVRIRDYERYVSIQFSAPRERVNSILQEVASLLIEKKVYKYHPLKIDNFATHDTVVIGGGVSELLDMLNSGRAVMREGGPTDLPVDDPFVQAVRRMLEGN